MEHLLVHVISININIFFNNAHHQSNELNPELQVLLGRRCYGIIVRIFAFFVIVTEHRTVVVEKVEIRFNAILKDKRGKINSFNLYMNVKTTLLARRLLAALLLRYKISSKFHRCKFQL